jgi:hypothetical protein
MHIFEDFSVVDELESCSRYFDNERSEISALPVDEVMVRTSLSYASLVSG